MATLQIIKKSTKTWLHIPSDELQFIIGKFTFSIDGDFFQIVEVGQAKRNKYNFADITVIDETTSTTYPIQSSIVELSELLESLSYPAFFRDGEVSGVASVNGLTGIVVVDGDNIDVTDPVDSTEKSLNDALQNIYDNSSGGAVSSVNGQTGAVSIDLESVLTEGNTATDLSIILNDNLTNNLSVFAQGIDIYGVTGKATLIAEASVSLADSVSGDESNLTNDTLVISNTTENQKVKVFKNKISREKGSFQTDLTFTDPTANRSIVFKDESGTVAYLSDIPTVDSTIINGSANAVSGNAVFDGLALKEEVFFKSTTTSTAVTGTTSNTILVSALIPANTFTTGSDFRVSCNIQRVGGNANATFRMYVNTTNSLSGATQLGTFTNGATNLFNPFARTFPCRATNLVGCSNPASNLLNDTSVTQNATYTTASFNFTVDNYIIIAVQPTSALDSFTSELFTIKGNR